ncbi:MAG: hypothetical protein ACLFUJ_14470, partial [Phycisphaerae bacterium]
MAKEEKEKKTTSPKRVPRAAKKTAKKTAKKAAGKTARKTSGASPKRVRRKKDPQVEIEPDEGKVLIDGELVSLDEIEPLDEEVQDQPADFQDGDDEDEYLDVQDENDDD